SRLPPYCGWDAFRSAALDIWKKWRKLIGPREIERVGLRYINRIDIPVAASGLVRIEDYLLLTPTFPDPNQVFFTYAIQTQMPIDEFVMTVNTGTAPPALIQHLSYLLDIDVAKINNVPTAEKELWEKIDEMRSHKNTTFESYITDATRELFA